MSSFTRARALSLSALTLASVLAAGCTTDENDATRGVVGHSAAALSAPTANECSFVTHDALSELLVPIDQAVELSDVDKAANGVTGAYASAANYANQYLRAARAKVVELDGLITQYGNPIYSMGPWYSFGSAEVWNQLDAATWQLQISAAYHTSHEARGAMELAGEAMERAAALRMHAVRCYTDAYVPLP
jgi:hypothetical protein